MLSDHLAVADIVPANLTFGNPADFATGLEMALGLWV